MNIGTSGTGTNGDQFYISINSSANYYTIRNSTLSVGNISDSRSVTTIQNGVTPIPWNNDNWIDKSFRATNPTTGQIINALFGDGNGNGAG